MFELGEDGGREMNDIRSSSKLSALYILALGRHHRVLHAHKHRRVEIDSIFVQNFNLQLT